MADSATVHLTEANFEETLSRNQGVLMVDFWAEWCGPCKAIAPVLEDLAKESAGRVTLAKVNVDENHGLAGRFGIRSIPTVLFVKAGKVAALTPFNPIFAARSSPAPGRQSTNLRRR